MIVPASKILFVVCNVADTFFSLSKKKKKKIEKKGCSVPFMGCEWESRRSVEEFAKPLVCTSV
jgi:hypothetical protein